MVNVNNNNNVNKMLFANLKCSDISRAIPQKAELIEAGEISLKRDREISLKFSSYTLVSCKKYTFLEKIECKGNRK